MKTDTAGIRKLLFLSVCVTMVTAYWGNESSEWYEEEPSCPHGDLSTHVCASLDGHTFTCVTVACCDYFEDADNGTRVHEGEYSSESSEEDDDEVEAEGDEDNVHYNEIESNEDECSGSRICYTKKSCTRYRCYQHCCDGYTKDENGNCRKEISGIVCANGGSAVYNETVWLCECQEGFHGSRCEIPVCECQNGGDCILKNSKPACNCSAEFHGDRCEIAKCDPACLNDGICIRDGHGGMQYCSCSEDYVGPQCEMTFVNSKYCPVPEYSDTVGEFCYTDTDCVTGQVCCKEGHSTMCRDKIVDYCVHQERIYDIGDTMNKDPCTTCTCMPDGQMHCETMECSSPACENPTTIEGRCCPLCSGEDPTFNPLPSIKCPAIAVPLPTDRHQDYATINMQDAGVQITAGTNVTVVFRPAIATHCYCKEPAKRPSKITAMAKDSYGNRASCTFQVVVADTESPKYTSCPEDMYIFEDELPHWSEPKYDDNVGIVRKINPVVQEHRAVGEYTTRYCVFDYDGNAAECSFKIVVTSSAFVAGDGHAKDLRNSSHAYKNNRTLVTLLGCFIGVLVLLAIGLLMCIVKRRSNCGLRTRDVHAHGNALGGTENTRTAAYETNIHVMSCHDHMKRLGYSDVERRPPVYSVKYANDTSDSVTMEKTSTSFGQTSLDTSTSFVPPPMEPPTYANAIMDVPDGYVTLPAARVELPLVDEIKAPIDESTTVSAK